MSVKIPNKMKEMIEYCGEILDDYTYSIDTETNGSNFFQSGRVTDNTPYSFMEWLKSAKLSEEFKTVLKDKDGLNKEKNPYYFFTYLDWDGITSGKYNNLSDIVLDECDWSNYVSLWLSFLLDKNWENITYDVEKSVA